MEVSVRRRHIHKDYFQSSSRGYFGGAGVPGKNGKPIELRENAGWLEWRYVDDELWIQLYLLPVLNDELTATVKETPDGDVDGVNTTFILTYTPIVTTVRVYLNGRRQVSGVQYTLTDSTITFAIAPFTDDIITVEYTVEAEHSFMVYNETPSGLINGVVDADTGVVTGNADFTLANAPNSASIYLNGGKQEPTVQFTISDNTLSFVIPPLIGDSIIADYKVVVPIEAENTVKVFNVVPSGDIDGVMDGDGVITGNADFELPHTPVHLNVYLNTTLQELSTHYMIVANTITFLIPPIIGDTILCDYEY